MPGPLLLHFPPPCIAPGGREGPWPSLQLHLALPSLMLDLVMATEQPQCGQRVPRAGLPLPSLHVLH